MKHLKNQLAEGPEDNSDDVLKSEAFRSTKICDLSGKKLAAVNNELITMCKESQAIVLNISKNQLRDLPGEY